MLVISNDLMIVNVIEESRGTESKFDLFSVDNKESFFVTVENRDFSSISPSAEFLIRLKAYTTIPFAKEAAALLVKGPAAETVINPETYQQFFFRLLIHFETRYRSIDNILSRLLTNLHDAGTPFSTRNFLELSSGFSFRCLDMCFEKNIHFIDTDLPELIMEKRKVVAELIKKSNRPMKGNLELETLNSLNENDFTGIINKFPIGPVTIINEGLLPYLNHEEKAKLCSIIHNGLLKSGGYWVTGDIYTKEKSEWNKNNMPDEAMQWREQHNTEENKFDDFIQAEEFFRTCGFDILYRESQAIDQLSCLSLLGNKKEEMVEKMKTTSPDRQTWCLQISPK
jgi:O-methyltransferase involved in polyketide biosynthesis